MRDLVPGLFSADGSGNGQAARFHPGDGRNSSENPAPKRSIIQLYRTGEGQSSHELTQMLGPHPQAHCEVELGIRVRATSS